MPYKVKARLRSGLGEAGGHIEKSEAREIQAATENLSHRSIVETNLVGLSVICFLHEKGLNLRVYRIFLRLWQHMWPEMLIFT